MHPYELAKVTAQALRAEYGFVTPRVLRSDLRRIYTAESITIDLRRGLRQLRGAYFYDDEVGPSILLAAGLPDEPTIFTMGHELKHHFIDRPTGLGLLSFCAPENRNELTEKAAEVFAAELIYPDADFIADCERMGIARGECDAAAIVRLKAPDPDDAQLCEPVEARDALRVCSAGVTRPCGLAQARGGHLRRAPVQTAASASGPEAW